VYEVTQYLLRCFVIVTKKFVRIKTPWQLSEALPFNDNPGDLVLLPESIQPNALQHTNYFSISTAPLSSSHASRLAHQ
jgi:hypothetical protein